MAAFTKFTNMQANRVKIGSVELAPLYYKQYFVDGNAGLDTNDGLSWSTAFKTLTVAFAASHASIAAGAAGWAARNAIYIKGDSFDENLTTLAQKTDIIGCGSCDHHHQARIVGNHVIGSTSYMGCRFINVCFKSGASGGVIMTVPTQQSGIAFIDCLFDGRSATAATKAILVTASEQFTVEGCRFIGKFSTTTIDVGTGSSRALLIRNNIIESGAIGITVHSGLTCADAVAMILNNVFDVVTLFIDENSDKVIIGGNRGRTQANGTVALTIDYNAVMAYDNIFAHSQGVSVYPVLVTIPT
jgi:hypothetical protein